MDQNDKIIGIQLEKYKIEMTEQMETAKRDFELKIAQMAEENKRKQEEMINIIERRHNESQMSDTNNVVGFDVSKH